MRIEIAEKHRLYSRTPGTEFLIPQTSFSVRLFPAKLLFTDLQTKLQKEMDFAFDDRALDMTFFLDLEKQEIISSIEFAKGGLRYRLFVVEQTLFLEPLRLPSWDVSITVGKKQKLEKKKKIALFALDHHQFIQTNEKISFGVTKKQEIEPMRLRCDLREFLPFLYRVSEICPQEEKGSHPLLEQLEESIANCDKLQAEVDLQEIYLSLFSSGLIPSLFDREHRGSQEKGKGNSFALVQHLREKIRSLFFVEEKSRLVFLPLLPPQLHCGRFIGIETKEGDRIDIEWSKKALKKVKITAGTSRCVQFVLPKEIKRFRLRQGKGRGEQISRDQTLDLIENKTYWFDRFQK